jgi:hypothetical protein
LAFHVCFDDSKCKFSTEGFRFGLKNNYRGNVNLIFHLIVVDVALIGDCQESVKKLVDLIGWKVVYSLELAHFAQSDLEALISNS